jgi:hypothetical protein
VIPLPFIGVGKGAPRHLACNICLCHKGFESASVLVFRKMGY